jgi:NAD(P)-dependent dehydrogenase (short-subunit alcohol dehydrogenase family)
MHAGKVEASHIGNGMVQKGKEGFRCSSRRLIDCRAPERGCGANQGVGLQTAKELVANGLTVLVGSRNLERGEAAAKEIGPGAIALQLDVTDGDSIAAAAERIRQETGRLDLLVNNAAISNTARASNLSLEENIKTRYPSNVSLDEVRAVWETNVFGVLAVYQAMLPLLRESPDARIVNVSSGVGSLTANAAYPYHALLGPVYPASKAALNAMTLAMMIELESTDIKVNLVSPAFTKTCCTSWPTKDRRYSVIWGTCSRSRGRRSAGS